jgi:hypothetical protein
VGYRISASWLDRIEREDRGLSAAKLIVLIFIYQLINEQLLGLCPGTGDIPGNLDYGSKPNAALLLMSSTLNENTRLWLPDQLITDPPPENTMLLASDNKSLPRHYRRGIIGRRDRIMEPMILAGSTVLIDTRKRAIAKRRDWNNDFDRPVLLSFYASRISLRILRT